MIGATILSLAIMTSNTIEDPSDRPQPVLTDVIVNDDSANTPYVPDDRGSGRNP